MMLIANTQARRAATAGADQQRDDEPGSKRDNEKRNEQADRQMREFEAMGGGDEDHINVSGLSGHMYKFTEAEEAKRALNERNLQRKFWHGGVIHPNSTEETTRQWITLLFVLYNAIWIPVPACFDPTIGTSWGLLTANTFIDIWFIVDVALTFRVGFLDEWGELVTNKKRISNRYLRGHFFLDCVSCFPLEIVGYITGVDRGTRLASFLRFPRILRFHRLYTSDRLLSQSLFNRLFRLLVALFLFCHWFGSLFFGLGIAQDREPNEWTGDPWIIVQGIEQADFFTKYINSLYYAMVTVMTVGYGDILPNTNTEKIFAITAIICGAIFYAVVFGNVTLLIGVNEAAKALKNEQLRNIETFADFAGVPQQMRDTLLQQTDLRFARTQGIDMHRVLRRVPQSLRRETLVFFTKDLMDGIEWFRGIGDECMSELMARLTYKLHLQDEYPMMEGSPAESMFILKRGILMKIKSSPIGGSEKVHGYVRPGEVFGEISLLLEQRRQYSVQVFSNVVELFSLSSTHFEEAMKIFPHAKHIIKANAVSRAARLVREQHERNEKQNKDKRRPSQMVSSPVFVRPLSTISNISTGSETGTEKKQAKESRDVLLSKLKKAADLHTAFKRGGASAGQAANHEHETDDDVPLCLCEVACHIVVDSGAQGWYVCMHSHCDYLSSCASPEDIMALESGGASGVVDTSAMDVDELVNDLSFRIELLARTGPRNEYAAMSEILSAQYTCRCTCVCRTASVGYHMSDGALAHKSTGNPLIDIANLSTEASGLLKHMRDSSLFAPANSDAFGEDGIDISVGDLIWALKASTMTQL